MKNNMNEKTRELKNKLITDTKKALEHFSPKNYGINSLLPKDLQRVKFRTDKDFSNLISFIYPIVEAAPKSMRIGHDNSLEKTNKALDTTIKPLFEQFLQDLKNAGHNVEDSDFGNGVGFFVCETFN